jgi:hypothetical protein
MVRVSSLLLGLFAAGCAPPGSSGGPTADAAAVLGGGASIGFDDLTWSARLDRVIAAGPDTGAVYVVNPATMEVQTLSSLLLKRPASADEGQGLVFVADRSSDQIFVFDPSDGRVVSMVSAGGGLDYVRYVEGRGELWATEPVRGGIEVFSVAADGTLGAGSFFATGGWPEGLTMDVQNGIALVHEGADRLAAIELGTHAETTVATGCSGMHGLPARDSERRLFFAGCGDSAEVVAVKRDGALSVASRHRAEGRTTVLGYSEGLHHFYLRADPGVPITVLGVSATGALETLGTFDASARGHALIADGAGRLFATDTQGGELLRFTDPYPRTP